MRPPPAKRDGLGRSREVCYTRFLVPHMSPETQSRPFGVARMDFNLPDLPEGFKIQVEDAVNAEIIADRAVAVRVVPRDEALALPDIIRTQSNLIPADEQEIRIVDIAGLDVQADGGTHVASTKAVGRVEVVKVESKGRANRRVRIRVVD